MQYNTMQRNTYDTIKNTIYTIQPIALHPRTPVVGLIPLSLANTNEYTSEYNTYCLYSCTK